MPSGKDSQPYSNLFRSEGAQTQLTFRRPVTALPRSHFMTAATVSLILALSPSPR